MPAVISAYVVDFVTIANKKWVLFWISDTPFVQGYRGSKDLKLQLAYIRTFADDIW